MPKIFMFVNVDWFFLSHRLPIAKVAAARGFDMSVFCDFTRSHKKETYSGFLFLQSPIKRTYGGFYSSCVEFFTTLQLIKRERPSVIHAVTIKPIIFLGIVCLIFRIPFIASISGLGPGFSPTSYWGKARLFIIKLLYRLIFSPRKTKVICQSDNDVGVLIDNRLVASRKIAMTEGSGVDLEEYGPKTNVASDVITVLMASRLLVDKGVREFCAAAGVIQKKYDFNVNFSLAGPVDSDSPGFLDEDQVIEMCESNKVQFLGSRRDLKDILAKTDIFVLPSYYAEGIPKVLLEAAAYGCAVITTDHPGCRDAIIPGLTGMLITPKDATSLENALSCILEDRELMESMGRAGRELAEKRFCVTRVIDIHYSLYHTFKNN
ncbi:glycosyltransferase family 4 protein [Alphaproteobacteria bacterium]|nr:glycosyltransferase family 4 protein [Alphaproteobacteria bacterium]